MPYRPGASNEAGMKPVSQGVFPHLNLLKFAAALSILPLAMCPRSASADQAQDVMKRMQSVYVGARAFDGEATITQTSVAPGKKQEKSVTSLHVRYRGPNLFLVNAISKMSGGPKGSSTTETIATSDGKQVYIYLPGKKVYVRRPCPPACPLTALFQLLRVYFLSDTGKAHVTLAAPTTVGGRSAYVVLLKPVLPPNLPPALRNILVRFVVDKQDYTLLQASQVAGLGSVSFAFEKQSLRPNLSGVQFAFHVPPGVKEDRTPPMPTGMPPTAPGARPR